MTSASIIESPLTDRHDAWCARRAEALRAAIGSSADIDTVPPAMQYLPFGAGEAGAVTCEIPAAYGEVALEYGALRRAAGVIDQPQRTVLRVIGADRLDLLDRLLTQSIRTLTPGSLTQAFLVERTGRIVSDLLIVELGEDTWIDLLRADVEPVTAALDRFIFAEDVRVEDRSADVHRIALHGRYADRALASLTGGAAAVPDDRHAARIVVAGTEVILFRNDSIGEPSFECIVPRDRAGAVWDALLAAPIPVRDRVRCPRPVGWFAWNVARVEAGTPLFRVDFGPTNVPHETGVVPSRVSFRKGCYPGQEIIARMESRGKSARLLTGVQFDGGAAPLAGAHVNTVSADAAGGRGEDAGTLASPIGVITSAVPAPARGLAPIGFAMVQSAHAAPGSRVVVHAEGEPITGTLVPVGPLAAVGADLPGAPSLDDLPDAAAGGGAAP